MLHQLVPCRGNLLTDLATHLSIPFIETHLQSSYLCTRPRNTQQYRYL